MGLFDLFKRSSPQPQPQASPESTIPEAERVFPLERARFFDLESTGNLQRLFGIPREQRDGAWQAAFWRNVWCASVELPQPQPFAGPDGFPYLRLDVPRPGPFDSQCLANLATDCVKAATGAAIFASPDDPPDAAQFVFSMGLLDSVLRFDSPDGDPIDLAEGPAQDGGAIDFTRPLRRESLVVTEARQVLLGTPSRDYLPP